MKSKLKSLVKSFRMVALRVSLFILTLIVKNSVSLTCHSFSCYNQESCAQHEHMTITNCDVFSKYYPFKVGCATFSIGYSDSDSFKYQGCFPYIFSDQCKLELYNGIQLLTDEGNQQKLFEVTGVNITVLEDKFHFAIANLVANTCNMCSDDLCN